MDFQPLATLIDLDMMDDKVGQAVYTQPTVFSYFSYFRPEYQAPGEAASAGLMSPEAEPMSAGKVIGILNGLFDFVDNSLENLTNDGRSHRRNCAPQCRWELAQCRARTDRWLDWRRWNGRRGCGWRPATAWVDSDDDGTLDETDNGPTDEANDGDPLGLDEGAELGVALGCEVGPVVGPLVEARNERCWGRR